MTGFRSPRQLSPQTIGFAFCIAGAALGSIGLTGWLIKSQFLETLIPGQPLMMPNTAVSLLLIGIAAIVRARASAGPIVSFFAIIPALFVLMIGIGTLAEYMLPLQIGLDQLVIRTQEGPYPGRMSPPTAVALALLSVAILVFNVRSQERARPSEWFALCAGVIASTALLGQLFGAGPLYRFTGAPIIGVAVHTALSLLLVSWGLILERPESGLMSLITSRGPGGVLLRRLAPLAVAAPVSFAILSIHLMRVQDQTQVDLLFAALTIVSTVASLIILAITAAHLNRAHEIIERMQTETSELIDLASDGIFVADLSGRYIEVNRAGCRMLGYTREEILAKTVMDVIQTEDLPRLENQRERLLGGAVRINDWNLVCKDGSLLPTEVSTKILPDGRWQAFVRDISDRKRAEREQLFLINMGTILPTTLDVDDALTKIGDLVVRDLADICIIDLLDDSNKLRRARVDCSDHINTTVCEMLRGLRSEYDWYSAATLGTNGSTLDVSLSTQLAVSWGLDSEQVRTLQNLGFRSAIETPLLARGKTIGRLMLITTNSRAFDSRDLPFIDSVGTLAALSLDNKRLYRDAKLATQARDEILAVVAHDLRNPLQIIATRGSALRRGVAKPIEDVGEEIEKAVFRMNRLIQDLLDVTQIEAGQLSTKPTRVPVGELIEDALYSQKMLASSSDIAMQTVVSHDLPDVLVDRDRIMQVLENLIGNAIKFTKPGGTITLAAEAGAREVLFSVADTGLGISEADKPHLFDRFWQTSKGRGRGAGLGLAIVKGIVEAHGGRVWFTSEFGKGSTFFFAIPRAPVGANKGGQFAPASAPPRVGD